MMYCTLYFLFGFLGECSDIFPPASRSTRALMHFVYGAFAHKRHCIASLHTNYEGALIKTIRREMKDERTSKPKGKSTALLAQANLTIAFAICTVVISWAIRCVPHYS